jgi:hypothetical protein
MLERHAVLVALHDHQLAPPPREMHAKRQLVAPAETRCTILLAASVSYDRVDCGMIASLERLRSFWLYSCCWFHRLALGGQLFGRDVAEGDDAAQKPFGERLIQHEWQQGMRGAKMRQEAGYQARKPVDEIDEFA